MAEVHPIQKAISDYIAANKEDPPVFDVKAPFKASALDSSGRYRMIDLKDEEFFLKGVRPGKRSEWIIELTPFSAAPYTQVEILDKDLDKVMPTLEPYLAKILGFEGSKWRPAVKKWLKKDAEDKAVEAGKVESAKYDTNPSWGSF